MALFVTISTAGKRGARFKYDEDDAAKAVAQTVAEMLPEALPEKGGAPTAFCVLVERDDAVYDSGSIAEAIESIRTAELERHARERPQVEEPVPEEPVIKEPSPLPLPPSEQPDDGIV